jgi:hypothetical protein
MIILPDIYEVLTPPDSPPQVLGDEPTDGVWLGQACNFITSTNVGILPCLRYAMRHFFFSSKFDILSFDM